jgi:D-sedoheptulose 7-phosphate isomerase
MRVKVMENDFLENYFREITELISDSSEVINDLIDVKKAILLASKRGKKIIIAGNGGSSAIASHFSVDLTKNANIRCTNFNEPDLITCFSNDYGYEHWVEKAVEFYGDEGDVFIGISSSGTSKNILNGCHAAREKKFSNVITLSGMSADNSLRQLGDINLWVDSKAYNHIENIHQFWLLAVVDLIIGKSEYSAN